MAVTGYDSISEALDAIKVSYELELINHASGDYYKVKVLAPLYRNKEYYLPALYSTDSMDVEDIHEDVLQQLAIKYEVGKGTFYYFH